MTPDDMAAQNLRNKTNPNLWADVGGIGGDAWLRAYAGPDAAPTTPAAMQAARANEESRADAGKTTQTSPPSPVGPSTPAAPAGGNYGWPVPNAQPSAAAPAQPAGNAAPAPPRAPQQASQNPLTAAMGSQQAPFQGDALTANFGASQMVNAYAPAPDNAETVGKLNAALAYYGAAPVTSLAQAEAKYPNYATTDRQQNPFSPLYSGTSAQDVAANQSLGRQWAQGLGNNWSPPPPPSQAAQDQPWYANSNLGRGFRA